jgi:hypothetical protein
MAMRTKKFRSEKQAWGALQQLPDVSRNANDEATD